MTPYIEDTDFVLWNGDCLSVLEEMAPDSVDCCVTSPPYFGLRDYGADGQIGLEKTAAVYVENMVEIFRQVRRVLTPAGTLWLNLGSSYGSKDTEDYRPKEMIAIPWMVGLALQADGWYLRIDVIWEKLNAMPQSVRDRPSLAHEYVLLLTKSPSYYYDSEAMREPAEWSRWGKQTVPKYEGSDTASGWMQEKSKEELQENKTRNGRSVWKIATESHSGTGNHFAAFPHELPRRCLQAGCPLEVCRTCGVPRERIIETSGGRDWRSDRMEQAGIPGELAGEGSYKRGRSKEALNNTKDRVDLGLSDCGHGDYRPGIVLDPFLGSGTTAIVGREMGLKTIGIELNPEYCELIAKRLGQQSLFAG